MFEKTLPDMIKGIRANPGGEAAFIATCITECRKELTEASGVPGASVRQNAVLKLIYLQSLGHDVSWAAFHIVDVMASPRFRGKRIGFLAASQTFTDSTDVLLLTTNLFRKAFASSAQHEASVAVGCLARIATPDLSRDLLGDVSSMLSSSRPLLRKKAVLCTYKLVVRSPDALAQAFPRLRERLDDPDPSVVACTVNVLTELAAASPKAYLGLAPALYKVLTTSSSNWTLIKVVKFLRQLVPHEPRLAKKLVQPLTHLIETTPAKSLQFECLYTVATTMASSQPELARLASSRLRDFVESPDPNLKSLGLLALAALQTSDKTLVEPCRDAVLRCLDDEPSVRAAALNLIAGMVTRQSLPELVQKLLGQVQVHANAYRDDVISVVLSACRADGFGHVPSFRWLVTTLLAVAALRSKHGVEVARLLLEVTLRVPTPSGPYYLPSEPKTASSAAGGGLSTPNSSSAESHSVNASGGTGGRGEMPEEMRRRLREVPRSPPRPLGGFEEDAMAEAVVDLHEEMPDGAEASDEEDEKRKRAEDGLAHGGGAAGGGQLEPALGDLLGVEGTSPQLPSGEGKRRRRKHRSTGDRSGGGGSGAAVGDEPLVSF